MLQGGGDALSFSFDNVLPGKYKGLPAFALDLDLPGGVKGCDRKVSFALRSLVVVKEVRVEAADDEPCISDTKCVCTQCAFPVRNSYFPPRRSRENQFVISSC